MQGIVLLGAGGHCKVIIDIIESSNKYKIIGIIDKNKNSEKVLGYNVLGDEGLLEIILNKAENAVVSLGHVKFMQTRHYLFQKLVNLKFKLPVLVHKHSVVSQYTKIGFGTCIMAGSVINPAVTIGENCIINTASIIEHDCTIHNNVHVCPKAAILGGVTIESNSFIGAGSYILPNLNIGKNVIIGAGSVVLSDVSDNCTVVGVPGQVIKTS